MPRTFLDDWRSGQVLTRTVVRAKCRYGPSHESVRQVGDEWWGEDGRSFECELAPRDVCPVCSGRGTLPLSEQEIELAQYDGAPAQSRERRCEPCEASGYVPGPHWPWRWPQPAPLQIQRP